MSQKIRRNILALLLLPVFLAAAGLCVHGAAAAPLWAAVDGGNAVLYLPEAGEITDCQVGTTPCAVSQAVPIAELETPMRTLIILDNSLSIPRDERPVIAQLLTNLIGNRMEGERFTIATIEDDIHYLCTDESDYLALGSAISGIEYQNQDTQLTDNVYQTIAALYESAPLQFSRVVIVADGVDDKEIGYTRAELQALIQRCGYPIYTVGCGPDNTAERTALLDNLFALSRITSGRAFYFGDTTDTYQIAQAVCEYNGAQQVVIPLPAEVCDGTVRAIKVVCNGVEYTAQLTMPFGSALAAPAPAPAQKPAASAPERDKALTVSAQLPAGGIPLWIPLAAGGGALVIIAAVVAALLVRRKKRRQKPAEQTPPPAPSNERKDGSEVIEILDKTPPKHWYDDIPSDRADPTFDDYYGGDMGESTVRVFGSAARKAGRRLRLADVHDPSRFYETALEGRVTVGRSSSCQITIDDASVSRMQCEIFEQGGRVYAVNCSQTNPTRMGQASTDTPVLLRSGAVLTMGSIQMRVEIL